MPVIKPNPKQPVNNVIFPINYVTPPGVNVIIFVEAIATGAHGFAFLKVTIIEEIELKSLNIEEAGSGYRWQCR